MSQCHIEIDILQLSDQLPASQLSQALPPRAPAWTRRGTRTALASPVCSPTSATLTPQALGRKMPTEGDRLWTQ
ncbi:hypothetical protein J4Q44_G00097820 [Coregonus suidteri]|uniref:Uncharacterized protein n=1 Tax=Coregonus suidteri TaxID=861788 RepID=A0AAN8QXT1_9TELE